MFLSDGLFTQGLLLHARILTSAEAIVVCRVKLLVKGPAIDRPTNGQLLHAFCFSRQEKPLMMFGQRHVTSADATVRRLISNGKEGRGGEGGGEEVWLFSGEAELELEILLLAPQWRH